MFNVHKATYTINEKRYDAIANFLTDELVIYGQNQFTYKCHLDEYTNFEGNMREFVEAKIKERENT